MNYGIPGNPVADDFPKGGIPTQLAEHLGRMTQIAELRLANLIAVANLYPDLKEELRPEIERRLRLR